LSNFASDAAPDVTTGTRWRVKSPVPADYVAASGRTPLVAQLLFNRGIDARDIPAFLDPALIHEPDPSLLPDVDRAVHRINQALLRGEVIGVFGDFDVDGMTATTVLSEGLGALGAKTATFIPNRFTQGHGLHASGVEWLKKVKGASLVLTCDCGISDLPEADKAAAMGVDLIVTDHHVPLARLPKAVAVVNAKRKDSRYPFTEFAGVGIAFKLMQALYRDKDASPLEDLLELVALGTVADMVPLLGENRALVHRGLKVLNRTTRPGLMELIRVSGLTAGAITSGDISWALGPRINSSGRMEEEYSDDPARIGTNTSLRLLTTRDTTEAQRLAGELNEINAKRQQSTAEVYERVSERLLARGVSSLLFDADPTYEEGVIGLVAGKVSKEFYRPAVVVTSGDDLCRGSARSIPEFDLAAALEQASDLLNSFGGHPLAAGFSVTPQNLPLLEERLVTLAEKQLCGLDLHPRIEIDAEAKLKDLGGESYRDMRALEPFGQQNFEPSFVTREVEVVDCRSMRNHEKWTSLRLRQNGTTLEAVDFRTLRGPDDIPPLIDVVYNLRLRRWNGDESLQAHILDLTPSAIQ
jgi:single-stranded-DNA-specific exonuclease